MSAVQTNLFGGTAEHTDNDRMRLFVAKSAHDLAWKCKGAKRIPLMDAAEIGLKMLASISSGLTPEEVGKLKDTDDISEIREIMINHLTPYIK